MEWLSISHLYRIYTKIITFKQVTVSTSFFYQNIVKWKWSCTKANSEVHGTIKERRGNDLMELEEDLESAKSRGKGLSEEIHI